MKQTVKIKIFSIITIFVGGIYAVLLTLWILALKNSAQSYSGDEIFRNSLFLCIFLTLFILKIITAVIVLKQSPGLRRVLKALLIGDISGGLFACYFMDSIVPAFLFISYYLIAFLYFLPKVYNEKFDQ